MLSYGILIRYPDSYPLLNDSAFINNVLVKAAEELANNPKAMMAEASAMYHNLLFAKCLPHVNASKDLADPLDQQLAFLTHILSMVKSRVQNF